MCVGPSRKVAIETFCFKIINGSSRRQGRGTRSSFWPLNKNQEWHVTLNNLLDTVILEQRDRSAAFDTVDHRLLLHMFM